MYIFFKQANRGTEAKQIIKHKHLPASRIFLAYIGQLGPSYHPEKMNKNSVGLI